MRLIGSALIPDHTSHHSNLPADGGRCQARDFRVHILYELQAPEIPSKLSPRRQVGYDTILLISRAQHIAGSSPAGGANIKEYIMRIFNREILPVSGQGVRGGLNGMILVCIFGIVAQFLVLFILKIIPWFIKFIEAP
jgi:hypothetical protein